MVISFGVFAPSLQVCQDVRDARHIVQVKLDYFDFWSTFRWCSPLTAFMQSWCSA